MKKIFVVIVTYNPLKWVKQCFDSLENSAYPVIPIVVDNNSNDGSIEIIKYKYTDVHIIENNENLGFGRANNIGIVYALKNSADFVFLLNQDAWVYPNTVELLLSHIGDYSIASPVHLDGSGRNLDTGYATYTKMIAKEKLFADNDFAYEVPYINAAAWFIDANLFNQIGGFDPLFIHYGEDVNLIQRLKFHKLKICTVPNSFICHDRKQVGNIGAFKRNYIRFIYLLWLADVNANFRKNFKSLFTINGRFIYFILINLMKLDFTSLNYAFSDFYWVISHRQEIRENRMKNKILGRNWLSQ